MADTGRCAVLDVSEVPKERPTGYHADGDVSDNDNDGDDGDDGDGDDTGRCTVLDVSEVPEQRPTGHHAEGDDGHYADITTPKIMVR